MTGGATIRIDTTEVKKMVAEVSARLGTEVVLQKAVDIIQQSVKYNFMVGGRPEKWKPLNAAYRTGQPLRKDGLLMNSISGQVAGGKGYVTTNVVYAATHNYGARKGQYGTKSVTVKSHSRRRGSGSHTVRSHSRLQQLPWGTIPKREFMMVQYSDITTIEGWLVKKVNE